MLTTGIDIVNVARIRRVIRDKKKAFLSRIFSDEEIAYCETKVNAYQHYAARFAAKEAFFKALPPSVPPLNFKDIEVHKKGNVPYISITPSLRNRYTAIRSVALSITHEKEFAAAVVVVESRMVKAKPPTVVARRRAIPERRARG
jgi:holo-[acyl-carrier protein] synthase